MMENNNRNVRKIFVLALLNHSIEPYTAKEIYDSYYSNSYSSMCWSLKKYCNQGLLKRKREDKKKPYKYEITEIGRERLFFLIGDTSIKSQIELLIEPIKELFPRGKIRTF